MPLAYGGLRRRTVALLLDWAWICAWLIVVVLAKREWLYALAPISVWAALAAMEGGARQASFGKREVGLRVIEAAGRPAGYGRAALRNFLKCAPWAALLWMPEPLRWWWTGAWILLTILTIQAGRRKRAWYDHLARTAVIELPRDLRR